MAYNPFDFFRKNQKILFAVLTVFIMIMFTLSWGANDFFQWFPKWLGTRSSGDVMAVVGGSKVRSSDLEEVLRARKSANQFMATAAGTATNKLMKKLDANKARVSEEHRAAVADMLKLRNGGVYADIEQANMFQDFVRQNPAMAPQLQPMLERMLSPQARAATLQRLRAAFDKMATAGKTATDKDTGELGQALLGLDTTLAQKQGQYFSDAPSNTYKDAIDFLLWKKKADQLGIRFTRPDVENLVDNDLGRQLEPEDRAGILNAMAEDRRRANADDIYAALGDEFRVRAAQQALVGSGAIRGNAAVPTSPDQTFARYNELAGETRWSVATVPVDQFLSKVEGTPSAQEMQDIFRKGQNSEPDPLSNRPAFKKPRELKIGFLEVTGKEAYYVAAAAEAMAKHEPAFNAGSLLVVPFGGGALAQVAGVGVSTVADKGLLGEYEKYKSQEAEKAAFEPKVPPQAFGVRKRTDVTAANLYKPEHVAALVGLSLASPVSGGVQVQAKAERMDETHRLAAQLLPIGPAGLGGAAGFAPNVLLYAVTRDEYPLAVAPKPLPLASVRDYVAERVRTGMQTGTLPASDLSKLMRDAQKAVADAPDDKAKGRAAAKALVDAFIATRKLADLGQVGASTKFADVFGIGSDPGLVKLRDRFAGPHSGMNLDRFGRAFFKDEVMGSRGFPEKEVDSQRFFQPVPYPEKQVSRSLAAESQFMAWLTEEIAASVPKAAEVKDRVEAEWRRQKARAKAKEVADALAASMAAAAKEKPGEIEVQLAWPDLAKKAGLEPPMGLPPMAELPIQMTEDRKGYTDGNNSWPPFFIPHPSEKAQQDLLANVNKPFGTTVVFADQPEERFYVAALTGRRLKAATEFADAAFAPIGTPEENPAGQGLPRQFARKARKAATDDALALLRAEFGYADENPKVNDKTSRGE